MATKMTSQLPSFLKKTSTKESFTVKVSPQPLERLRELEKRIEKEGLEFAIDRAAIVEQALDAACTQVEAVLNQRAQRVRSE